MFIDARAAKKKAELRARQIPEQEQKKKEQKLIREVEKGGYCVQQAIDYAAERGRTSLSMDKIAGKLRFFDPRDVDPNSGHNFSRHRYLNWDGVSRAARRILVKHLKASGYNAHLTWLSDLKIEFDNAKEIVQPSKLEKK